MLLATLEFDSSLWPRQTEEEHNAPADISFKRQWIVEDFIPADPFLRIIHQADEVTGSSVFSDWADEKLSFLRFNDSNVLD